MGPDGFEELTVSCRWKDQGWGGTKGRLSVEVRRGPDVICSHDCFGVAPHGWERKSKTFSASDLKNPRCQDVISFGFVVGGGGGHELHVEDLKLAVSRKTTGVVTTPSGGYPPSSIPAAPTPAAVPSSDASKEKMQAFLKS